jgi:glutathione S-transferase
MYTLYIANKNYSSWSLRPWVLMQQLGIPFEEHLVPFSEVSNRDTFRKFAANGKVPCLHVNGHSIWDSLAIIEFLAESHDGVWPADQWARAWARSASAEMHSGFGALREHCTMNCGIRVKQRQLHPSVQSDIERIDELWADGLTRFGGQFLAGDKFSAVDAMFAPVAFRIQTYGLALSEKSAAYATRLLQLPSLQAWYQDAINETWRESAHEQEAKATGIWTADFRRS